MKVFEVLHDEKKLMGEFEADPTARIYSKKKYKHQWLKKNGEDWYFKEREPNTDIYLGDVLAPYIFEKVGFRPEDYVMYYLVEMQDGDKTKHGVLSKKYIKKNEFQFSYYDVALFSFCIDNNIDYQKVKDDKIMGREDTSKISQFEKTLKANPGQYLLAVDDMLADLKRFCEWNRFKCDYQDVEFKLKRMIISDFFLCQCDRHRENMEFKMSHGNVKMCPIFDHEHCLAIDLQGQAYNMKKYPIYTGFSSVGAYKDDFVRVADNLMTSSIMGKEQIAKSLKENAEFIENSRFLNNDGLMACDIVAECLADERLADVVYNFLDLDINKTLEQFEKDYMKINPFIKECISLQYDIMKEKFARTFNAIDKKVGGHPSEKFVKLKNKFEKPLAKINNEISRKQQESRELEKNKGKLSKEDEELLKFLG